MTQTETNRRGAADRAFARAMEAAIEMGLISSVAEFRAKSDKAQCNILASVSRRNTRRHGQGWSR